MKLRFLIFTILLLIFNLNSPAQNRNLSGGVVFDGEPYLAVNPQNPQHMVVAWMGFVFMNRIMIKTRMSIDGGKNWSTAQNTPHFAAGYTSADPSIAFDNNGNVFLCLIDYDPYFTSGAVYVRKSTDGGLSWGNPVEAINYNSDPGKMPIDRPWICTDRSGGEYNGNIYVTTMNAQGAGGPPFHPYFIRSVNNGISFEPWRYADSAGWLSGPYIPKPMPTPAVSANGTFYCIYPSLVYSQNILPQFILATSENAGSGFTYSTVIQSGSSVAVTDTSAKKGYLLKTDPSDPLHLGFFYLSIETGDADVYYRESADGGLSWSESQRVNDDPQGNGRMQDLLWAAYDTDGDLAVAWRDRRNAADTGYAAAYEIYGAVKLKNSSSFSSNFRLSDTAIPFDDILLEKGNDFMSIELYNDTISAVWGDNRNGKLNIWFQRMTLNGSLVSIQQIAEEEIPDVQVFQSGQHLLSIKAKKIFGYTLFDISGKILINSGSLQGNISEIIDISGLHQAVYFVKIETEEGTATVKIQITK